MWCAKCNTFHMQGCPEEKDTFSYSNPIVNFHNKMNDMEDLISPYLKPINNSNFEFYKYNKPFHHGSKCDFCQYTGACPGGMSCHYGYY